MRRLAPIPALNFDVKLPGNFPKLSTQEYPLCRFGLKHYTIVQLVLQHCLSPRLDSGVASLFLFKKTQPL